ncbi:MAG: beta-lactamase family protein, partial [Pseudomonadota bacterium]
MHRKLAMLIWLAVAACPAAAESSREADVSRLLETLDAVRREHNVAAFALTLVNADAVLWTGARGIADRRTQRPATADTLFRIGSITKTFTALALLMAEQQGLLRLDDALLALAPDAPLANPWRNTQPVQLSHLLEHTAGLLDLTRAEFDHSDPKPLTLRDALQLSPDARVAHWAPGLHSSYSNAGAGLAAYALEHVSGKRFEDYVESQLFAPLAMSNAGFFLDAQTRQRLATGYDTDGETVIPYWHMIFRPFGAINATPREMAGFVQLLLNRGRIGKRRLLPAAAIARMETPRTTLAATAGLSYGYGLGNYQFVHNGFLFHGHGGDGDGYLAHLAYNRDSGMGYFLVINAFNGRALREMRSHVQDFMVRGLTPSPPPAAPGTAGSQLTGRYVPVTRRFPWQHAQAL